MRIAVLCTQQTEYSAEVDHEKARLLHKINGKTIGQFNQWFNQMFEKAKVKDAAADSGYENWYRSGEVEESNDRANTMDKSG